MVIIAGGAGTRMTNILGKIPKCLAIVNGVSILEHNVSSFIKQGITRYHFLLGIGSEQILKEIALLQVNLGFEVTYQVEAQPLGTGGALLNATTYLEDTFFVCYGDVYIETDLEGLDNSIFSFEVAQLFHPSSHMEDSDLIGMSSDGSITHYFTKPRPSSLEVRNSANAGVYAFRKTALERNCLENSKIDLDRGLLPHLLELGVSIQGVRNIGYVKDAGTPDRLQEVIEDSKKLFKSQIIKPAIFLDRDGTLNIHDGYISDPSKILLHKDCVELIKTCNNLGIRVLVVTNQPIIARGEATFDQMQMIHARIDNLLGKIGVFVDDYFLCPHHPDSGFEGEITDLKISCECRKPKVGLIEQAIQIYPTDLNLSLVVGDTWRDIELGKNFGINTILINRIGAQLELKSAPTLTLSSLLELEKIVIKQASLKTS